MRMNDKQWNAATQKDIFTADLHQFIELEGQGNYLEIASELGISIGEVKLLKKKLSRS
ncbi:hypothetical protein [Oceanobacillus massiliensis]|uniref:hypothetical protein n=1 Tax=Oceanobacillus massiliensis TaxID=1465765 RepID=UPI000288B0D7|nr:hypothetical protein [Oceanobacillus massiliensis]